MSTNIQSNNGSLKIFCAYAHKDEQLRNELEKHLKVLQREGLIDVWHDRRIVPGIEWDKEIQKELAKADIILLLISSDFIFSDYAYDREMQTAVERHEKGNAIVIPVLLRPVDWVVS